MSPWPGRQVGARPSHRVWLHTGGGGGGARGLSPGGQAAPTLQHYSALDTWSHYTSQPPGVMFLEGASEGHPEGPGLGHKNSQS